LRSSRVARSGSQRSSGADLEQHASVCPWRRDEAVQGGGRRGLTAVSLLVQ
jgi:hypothetical protein